VPEQEPIQVIKLSERVVTEGGRLVAFIALNPEADVGTLNHIYVIGSVSDCPCDGPTKVGLVTDKLNNFSFLSGRTPIDDNSLHHLQDLGKEVSSPLGLEDTREDRPLDHQASRRRSRAEGLLLARGLVRRIDDLALVAVLLSRRRSSLADLVICLFATSVKDVHLSLFFIE